jgi:multiple sugar transport system ATP-binding protein
MVFQSYALYPHLSVRENVAFPLRVAGQRGDAVDEAVRRVAATLDIGELLDARPAELSGGQRQRVAMARALVREPAVFLLDEPLSNLDARLRAATRVELKTLQRELGITTLYVTHDQVEAMTLGDRIAVLRDGAVEQIGTAAELYDAPCNPFVARFVGEPQMNLQEVTVAAARSGAGDGEPPLRLRLGEHELTWPAGRATAAVVRGGEPTLLGIRPEHVQLAEVAAAAGAGAEDAGLAEAARATVERELARPVDGVATAVLRGEVEAVEYLGRETLVHVRGDGWHIAALAETAPGVGARVELRLRLDRAHLFARED